MKKRTNRRSLKRSAKRPNAGNNLWPGYYDVVIIPPVSVQRYAIDLSRRLHKLGGKWSLGRNAFIPHVSLYHIPVGDHDWAPFLEALQVIAAEAPTGELETTGFNMPV